MLEKWVRASRSAQTRYNRICHIWSAKPRNFHFEKSKMYSQERKLLRAICDAFPDSEIAVSFSNLCNKDRDDRKFEIDIFCHDTEINGKVYVKHVNITYFLNGYVYLSYRTVSTFRIIEFNYKNISSLKPILDHINKSLAEIEFNN